MQRKSVPEQKHIILKKALLNYIQFNTIKIKQGFLPGDYENHFKINC